MTDQPTTYESQAELAADIGDPRYSQSARYREGVAAKLQASIDAGTIARPAQFTDYDSTIYSKTIRHEPEAMYGSANPLPKPHPLFEEAQKVGSGFFDGPAAIAAATGAPQWYLDPSYQQAVKEKIDRSIREKWISPGLEALDPSQRFTR